MKNRGFTLVELLGIIVVLGIIATIATPIVQKTIKQNREKMYNVIVEQLIDSSKDWAAKNSSNLPDEDGESVDVTLGELKESGLLQINVVNPKNNNVFSNQSYVRITRKNNNFTYDVMTYDLVDADEIEEDAPSINLNGNQVITLSVGEEYSELGAFTGVNTNDKNVSVQIIKNEKEVSTIDTSEEGTYAVYYSLLGDDNKLGINIRTVIIK